MFGLLKKADCYSCIKLITTSLFRKLIEEGKI
jgi:hypothetical protein